MTFRSADEAVATVNRSGTATGVSEGATTITATVSGDPSISAVAEVIVSSTALPFGVEWTKQFGSEEFDTASALATDPEGNLIIVGITVGNLAPGEENQGREDAFVGKYAPDGELIWLRQFGTAGDDGATSVAVDASGDIIVAGYAAGPLTGENAGTSAGRQSTFIRKYSSDGTVLWTEQIDAGGNNHATGVAVDGDQYVTITGSSNASKTDPELPRGPFIRQYRPLADGSGVEEAWTRRPEREEPHVPLVAGIATDSQNNVVVVGTIWETREGGKYADSNVLLVKYTQDGEVVWQTSYDVGHDKFIDDDGERLRTHEAIEDGGRAVTVGPDDSIYVAGYMGMTNLGAFTLPKHPTYEYGGRDDLPALLTYGLTSGGGEAWRDDYGEYGYEAGSYYTVTGIALGQESSLYVIGSVAYQLGDEHHGDVDYFVRRYALPR